MSAVVPFGKYLLLERLSVGGMAEVFRAKTQGVQGFEKVIAIKRILPSLARDQEYVQMFVDEAKLAGGLRHPNICHVFELGRVEKTHYMAMEYIWGKDLLAVQQRLAKLGQIMPRPLAALLVANICRGLDYAHRKTDPRDQPLAIVHRDCSPQNVLLSFDGAAKLIDFGIAKSLARTTRTSAGVLRGKYAYMAPEQVTGDAVDRRADLFALGAILFECLAGHRLFEGDSEFAVLDKVKSAIVPPLREAIGDLPAAIERVLQRCLQRSPDDRYQWASEMATDLEQYLAELPAPTTSKALAVWMRTLFAREVASGESAQAAASRIGATGLIEGAPAAEVHLETSAIFGELEATPEATRLDGPRDESARDPSDTDSENAVDPDAITPPPQSRTSRSQSASGPLRSHASEEVAARPAPSARVPVLPAVRGARAEALRHTAPLRTLARPEDRRRLMIASGSALILGGLCTWLLVSRPPAPLPENGMLVITSAQTATVIVNGATFGEVQGRLSLPAIPGRHHVIWRRGETAVCTETAVVLSAQATEVTCSD